MLSKNDGRLLGKRGGKNKSHPFLIHQRGDCYGGPDGCKAKFDLGIEENDLLDHILNKTETVKVSMIISGEPCTHLWKKCYGKLTGRAREKEVRKIVTGPEKLIPPSTRAKKSLMKVDSSKFAVGNHVGQATD